MKFEENSKPIYLQIADSICDSIVCGEYKEGERIPSVRECAAMAEVNSNTAMRAYETLAQRKIIGNKRGIGYSVLTGAQVRIVAERGEALMENGLDGMFNILMHMGVTPDALRDSYAEYLSKNKKL